MATSSATEQSSGKPADSQAEPRRTSFSFLRRQKSNTGLAGRSASGGKMSKKQKAQAQEELLRQQREAAALPKQPPQLPQPPPLPTINTFGGENARDSYQFVSRAARGHHHQGPPPTTRPSMDYKTPTSPQAAMPFASIPGSPSKPNNGEYVDPYARTESMTHRGRYSYASSAVSTLNSPRRVRRRKDPTPFNILVIGAKNSGKTSFINFLQTSLSMPKHKRVQTPPPQPPNDPSSPFTSQYLETEIENERIGVTLWDSQGLEKNVVDLQLREMAAFIESKFEETFSEEQKVVRSAGVRDTHIHCVFLLLDPIRLEANGAASRGTTPGKFAVKPTLVGSLDDDLDLQVLRILQGKTAVVPVISKADTITAAHMAHLKKSVWDSLKQAKLDPLEALSFSDSDDESAFDEREEDEFEDSDEEKEEKPADVSDNMDKSDSNASDDESSTSASSPPPKSPSGNGKKHARRVSTMSAQIEDEEEPLLPLSIISPDMYEPSVIGRRFAWGFADPMNPEHCDFVRLKESVFSEWRAELREASRERWYEGWRTSRLKKRTGGATTPRRMTDNYGSSPSFGNGVGSPVNKASSYNSMTAF
ncbi:putative sep4b protein [Lasiodiplodia theobromae]|uniref:Cell division protein GTP binding protein n=1 Tax=Lasiodiplodia theobromae TaxID=45133 RepID=UPI0015C3230B|nr:Cell division protein GTP binding protein [Lasiodiplodia theobromae]KAF4541346.1 Cell division protein GTP binding protein [Lasiodiplodia theobromae]KAF9632691.1 putative sep4b protein [Lasiodiplodia theobromae]